MAVAAVVVEELSVAGESAPGVALLAGLAVAPPLKSVAYQPEPLS